MARSSHRLSPAQRAAALLVALGPQAASGLLPYLDEAEVEALTAEVAGLEQLPSSTVDEIVEDLRRQATNRRSVIEGGMAYARKLLEGWGPRGEAILERVAGAGPTGRGGSGYFGFLAAVPPEEIVRLLAEEHPQTSAVILAQLDPHHAGTVLAQLEPVRRGDVAARIACLEAVSPETIRRLEAALAPRVSVEAGPVQTLDRGEGAKDLAAILNSCDRETESAILASLETLDANLFGRVRSLLFIFDDLINLQDRDLQEALRAVDAPTLALALKGTTADVRETIMRNLSERARTGIIEEMEVLGLVRRTDVEEARTKVVAAVRKLEEEGRIVLRPGAEGGMVE
ncbi:MAG TPA: flagellar motor switch protein FliG [Actinomycetota bacterium]|jgi:flagellar motor switch protein FliG